MLDILEDTYNTYVQNVSDTALMFDRFGFVIHPEKSMFFHKQRIVFLGFDIDSVDLKIYLMDVKKSRIKSH